MSDETQDDGCGMDVYAGGPLVIELSRADSAVSAMLEVLEAARQKMYEAMAVPSRLLSAGPRIPDFIFSPPAGMTISWSKPCDPLSWGDSEPDLMAITRDIARS